jgi:hypothetical protein
MKLIASLCVVIMLALFASVSLPGLGPVVSASETAAIVPSNCVSYLFGSGSTTGGKTVTFRVKLAAPAGAGGTVVNISSNNQAIPVPATVTVAEGLQETTFQVGTNPVATTVSVTVSASAGGCSHARVVVIKAPILRSLSVQSVMRAEGLGKITVCLTGNTAVNTSVALVSSQPAIIGNTDIVIPAGKACFSYKTPVGAVVEDTNVALTVSFAGASLNGSTIVHDFAEVV